MTRSTYGQYLILYSRIFPFGTFDGGADPEIGDCILQNRKKSRGFPSPFPKCWEFKFSIPFAVMASRLAATVVWLLYRICEETERAYLPRVNRLFIYGATTRPPRGGYLYDKTVRSRASPSRWHEDIAWKALS